MLPRRHAGRAALLALLIAAPATTAQADLQLCNKTSYVLEAVLGLEDKGAAATRGWFRIDPGQCRSVLAGKIEAEKLYVHARALPVYGASPLPQAGHADLCIADGNFVIAGTSTCNTRRGQRLARFTAIKPSETDQGLAANLAEEAEYSPEQARLAGVQRLLVIAGYDANPIDGLEGKKTTAALDQFLRDRKLGSEVANQANFFDVLLDAVKTAEGVGFSWCNETSHTVMAALGQENEGTVTTRGWYRLDPGKCVKPEVSGKPRRLYSFGEAVDKDGHAIRRGDKALAWGGGIAFCTRPARFELSEHGDCAGRGLNQTGFATIDLAGRMGATVRFRD